MAAHAGPNIIEEGLVLCLDAGNERSYPGTGTTWYDLSGNGNNGTLVNGVTYNSQNGGVLQFDGVNDEISITGPNLVSTNYTVIGGSRYSGSTRKRIISGGSNNWLLGHWSGGSERHYAVGWITSSSGGANDLNWRIYTGTGNISSDQYYFWINDSIHTGPSTGGSQGPNGFRLGRYYGNTTEYSTGQISFLLAYNKILTNDEIKQTYAALRGRFGI
jgi:hypothetical protein